MKINLERLSLPISVMIGLAYLGVVLFVSLNYYPIGGLGIETDFYWDYAPAADAFYRFEFPYERLQFRGLGYPIVLATLGWLGDTFLAGKIISAVSASIVVALMSYLLIRRFGLTLALAGCGVFISNGVFFEYSIRVGTDMFFLMLNVLVISILGLCKSFKSAAFAGLIAGWAFLTRYNGIALVATVAIWVIWLLYRDFSKEWKRALIGVLGFTFPIAIWMIINLEYSGNLLPKANIHNILYEIKASDEIGWEEYWYGEENQIQNVSNQGKIIEFNRVFGQAFVNLKQNLFDDMETLTGVVLTALALAGIVTLMFRQRYSGIWFWGMIAGFLNYFTLLLVFHSPRFSLCLLPLYIVAALLFLEWLVEKLKFKSRVFSSVLLFTTCLFLISASSPQSWSKAIQRINQSPKYLLHYSDDIQHKFIPAGKIAARKPHLPYLLNMPFAALPILNNSDELLDWMKTNKVNYLFLTAYSIGTRPQLAGLLGKNHSIDGLEQIAYWEKPMEAGFWKRIN